MLFSNNKIVFVFVVVVVSIKEKPTGWWHTRNTHVTKTGSSKIFKCMVPVDYL